jgi:2-keto-4-pentenoate hydratase/2-oxohepta-3-ene-1,7-dioic acid hydratase in catechol pathway/putative intracellular protease/amidase
MRSVVGVPAALLSVVLLAPTAGTDDAPGTVPFRLGTFEHQGRVFVGLVRGDQAVVDIAAASAALEKSHPAWPKLRPPADMKELIARYEADGVKERLHAISRELATARAPYVHERSAVKVRPPILYPETMLNAAVNYTEHNAEMAGRPAATPTPAANPPRSAPGLWERGPDDQRWNPYLFFKPRTAVIADGEAIRIPPGRDQIDWECELLVVVGRRASHVPLERAADYIFGYSLENDVSDRGGRGDSRFGSDWLVGKAHDTFAPQGPFIVPKEFVKDPQKLGIQFSLSGTLMQDSSTARMTHTVYELLHYASNILTLQPGDVISTGSPAGVGSARNPPIFMKPGDVASCTIEGIGTLTNPVAAAEGGSAVVENEKVIALVLFPEVTLLDLVGPLQVLKGLPAPYRTVVVGERREPVPTDAGVAVTPERTFAEVPRPFAIVVPGGPGSVAAMGNAAIQDYLRSAAPGAEVVASVCTGGLVLAATGLLEGRRATTHWAYADELEKLGGRYVRERWVEDGKFITAGGVSAGIDMALALAERLTDAATARRIQLGIEYDPHPPLGGIDWSRVGEAELARQRLGGTGQRLKDAARLLAGRPDLLRRLGLNPEP